MKDVYIVSTMTAPVSYCFWDSVDGLPVKRDSITINGGAHIPSTRSGFGIMTQGAEGQPIWTADGVVTRVPAERYALLKDNEIFKKHLARGLLAVVGSDISENHRAVKKVVSDMKQGDQFKQYTPESYKKTALKIRTTLEPETTFRL